ncbi:MAG: ferrous iron transport protein A, partial [Desulfonatronovibrionaceae bacterium]
MIPKPITEFPSGSKVKIASFDAGGKARCRFCSLGLIPGTEVEVSGAGSGPLRIRVRGSDMVIGNGMAEKI